MLRIAVDSLVPQEGAALTLTVFQLGIALLEAVDELGHVRLVGLPEKRHGGTSQKRDQTAILWARQVKRAKEAICSEFRDLGHCSERAEGVGLSQHPFGQLIQGADVDGLGVEVDHPARQAIEVVNRDGQTGVFGVGLHTDAGRHGGLEFIALFDQFTVVVIADFVGAADHATLRDAGFELLDVRQKILAEIERLAGWQIAVKDHVVGHLAAMQRPGPQVNAVVHKTQVGEHRLVVEGIAADRGGLQHVELLAQVNPVFENQLAGRFGGQDVGLQRGNTDGLVSPQLVGLLFKVVEKTHVRITQLLPWARGYRKVAGTRHNPRMQEIELKFQIPQAALQGVQDRLNLAPGHTRERLQAHYFDTLDRRLGQARSALRLRQEGDRWVQTLKALGANTMIRLEDNQAVTDPAAGSAAKIDLGRHRGGAAEASLVKALAWNPEVDPAGDHTGLVELYRTDIWRQTARVKMGQGTPFEGVVELALDLGHIRAGELSLPVCELEIELLEGQAMAVIVAARRWVERHALWLDTRTKAHRGDRLARQAGGQGAPAFRKPSAATNLASGLEQITDAMSLVALGGEGVDQATSQWRQAFHSLATLPVPLETKPAVTRFMQELDRTRTPVELARAPSTTLLCLDLFAVLL